VEFSVSENSYSLKRVRLIFFICVVNDCRAVGDPIIKSAEFQCDCDHLRFSIIKRISNCPHEIFSELKGVVFELAEVVVEREARQGWLFV